MFNHFKLSLSLLPSVLAALYSYPAFSASANPAPNGIELPTGYQDWKIISQSHRIDNHSLRIILGNDIAVKAARADNIHPWPEGSILAKLVWKQKAEDHWPTAIAPDKFVHAEFMIKNSEKFNSTGGWGYARWLGLDQQPYGSDKDFAFECVACHTPVKSQDYVFTRPAKLPH